MANEKEVVAVLNEGNMMKLNVVDTAKMTYLEQLKVSETVHIIMYGKTVWYVV